MSAGSFGVALPHRAAEPLRAGLLADYARRAEAAGFRDLWVTENVIDPSFCMTPALALTHAAAVTTRIGFGVAVLILPLHNPIHVADAFGTLQTLSGGRSILGVGLGKEHHYAQFGVPLERRVSRLTESVAALRALWRDPVATFEGELISFSEVSLSARPATPPPIWFGGGTPAALDRAARLADGWVGSGGGESNEHFRRNVAHLRSRLETHGRDAAGFPISKRVFLAVDADRSRAQEQLASWFGSIYGNAALADTHGVAGSRAEVADHVVELRSAGATHIILNPVGDYLRQLDELTELVDDLD